jgi:hypothetical protein
MIKVKKTLAHSKVEKEACIFSLWLTKVWIKCMKNPINMGKTAQS